MWKLSLLIDLIVYTLWQLWRLSKSSSSINLTYWVIPAQIVLKTTKLSFCECSESLKRLDIQLEVQCIYKALLGKVLWCAVLSPWNTPKGITLLCQVTLWSTVCMKVELQYTLSPWQAPQVKRILLSLKLILTLNNFTYTPICLMKNVPRENSALWRLLSWPTRFAFLTQHTIIDKEWNVHECW